MNARALSPSGNSSASLWVPVGLIATAHCVILLHMRAASRTTLENYVLIQVLMFDARMPLHTRHALDIIVYVCVRAILRTVPRGPSFVSNFQLCCACACCTFETHMSQANVQQLRLQQATDSHLVAHLAPSPRVVRER